MVSMMKWQILLESTFVGQKWEKMGSRIWNMHARPLAKKIFGEYLNMNISVSFFNNIVQNQIQHIGKRQYFITAKSMQNINAMFQLQFKFQNPHKMFWLILSQILVIESFLTDGEKFLSFIQLDFQTCADNYLNSVKQQLCSNNPTSLSLVPTCTSLL